MAQAVKHWTNEPSISNARILSATKNAAKHVKSLLLATTSDVRLIKTPESLLLICCVRA